MIPSNLDRLSILIYSKKFSLRFDKEVYSTIYKIIRNNPITSYNGSLGYKEIDMINLINLIPPLKHRNKNLIA